MSTTTAVFAGTFDPVTNGHVDLVLRARRLFPRVIVSVVRGTDTLFDEAERIALLTEALAEIDGLVIEGFTGLVVEQARRHGAAALVRGMRSFQDWDYETQMAFANRGLADEIDTVFLPPSPGMTNISSSLVREVASLGGDVSGWVPPHVGRALQAKLQG
ncbi:MAG: pantetheine-phosphate adenylyltransferase [Planctomycetota bacterium]|nr:pantetheine-phosphate adenylyltransferase [Planctomycetota bacterium]